MSVAPDQTDLRLRILLEIGEVEEGLRVLRACAPSGAYPRARIMRQAQRKKS